jgi:phosphomethylpyrimidine synthase
MCRPHFCSIRITQDVRKFATEQKISAEESLHVVLKEKAKEFAKAGEVYAKA